MGDVVSHFSCAVFLKMLRLYSAVILACLAVTLIGSPVPIGKSSRIDPVLGRDPELNPDLFEGDILGISSAEDARNAILNEARYWPGGVIYYAIDPAYPLSALEQQTLEAAKEAYRTNTCLRLVERNGTTQSNYVIIRKTGGGCSSYVGMIGGAQQMSLDASCYRNGEPGTVIHEFMHSAGFHHEQSRTDRDTYVFVNYTNIQPGKENNFVSYDENTITSLGEPYDWGSVLHYGPYGFAIDPSIPTITPINQTTGQYDLSIPIGQRVGFSQVDINKLNKLYKC